MNWSTNQQAALDAVAKWHRERSQPIFRLFGPAGTGKSTLARHFAEGLNTVLYMAFTGKAAKVMRAYGCSDATTIHRSIYNVVPAGSTGRLLELQEQAEKEPLNLNLRQQIEDERAALRRPRFVLDPESPVKYADLVIVDEVSMVGDRLGADLCSFGTPILALGDPYQLPPVRGHGYFTGCKADHYLTDDDIRRQALDNPIIALATSIRQGKRVRPGQWGESRVVTQSEWDKSQVEDDDQVIVGRNRTRVRANRFLRERQLGSDLPPFMKGDRLICLKNRHDVGLLNGATYDVVSAYNGDDEKADLIIRDDEGTELKVQADLGCLNGEEPLSWDREVDRFDYGYSLTCHKSQGSQYPSVVVVDESRCFRGNESRWLYTAVTRAAEKVTVVL